jgi:hypothetical protein
MLFSIIVNTVLLIAILAYRVFAFSPSEPLLIPGGAYAAAIKINPLCPQEGPFSVWNRSQATKQTPALFFN